MQEGASDILKITMGIALISSVLGIVFFTVRLGKDASNSFNEKSIQIVDQETNNDLEQYENIRLIMNKNAFAKYVNKSRNAIEQMDLIKLGVNLSNVDDLSIYLDDLDMQLNVEIQQTPTTMYKVKVHDLECMWDSTNDCTCDD